MLSPADLIQQSEVRVLPVQTVLEHVASAIVAAPRDFFDEHTFHTPSHLCYTWLNVISSVWSSAYGRLSVWTLYYARLCLLPFWLVQAIAVNQLPRILQSMSRKLSYGNAGPSMAPDSEPVIYRMNLLHLENWCIKLAEAFAFIPRSFCYVTLPPRFPLLHLATFSRIRSTFTVQ